MANKLMRIGVNRDQISQADLRSCVNDVENLQPVLTQYSGFGGSDIVTFLDDTATKANIQAAVAEPVGGPKKRNVVLQHLSGRGSNVRDNDGDEADHRDEIPQLEGHKARLAQQFLSRLA